MCMYENIVGTLGTEHTTNNLDWVQTGYKTGYI
jgi:hypothetical protein